MNVTVVFVSLAALPTCGCELIVGTDDKVVADAAADAIDTGNTAAADAGPPDASGCTACVSRFGACQTACAQTSATCQSQCMDNGCDGPCKKTESHCVDVCTTSCVSCAQSAGCADTSGCHTPLPGK